MEVRATIGSADCSEERLRLEEESDDLRRLDEAAEEAEAGAGAGEEAGAGAGEEAGAGAGAGAAAAAAAGVASVDIRRWLGPGGGLVEPPEVVSWRGVSAGADGAPEPAAAADGGGGGAAFIATSPPDVPDTPLDTLPCSLTD